MQNLGYLFAAFTIIWMFIFGYLFFLYRKQRNLQREVKLLKESIDKQDGGIT